MWEAVGELAFGFVIGVVIMFFIICFVEGGGVSLPGTGSRRNINDEQDRRISNKFRNGTGSSKADLQQWHDSK